ncbi:uncharacterized protein V6R79_019820 [Siganus canaliculatus]
MQTLVLLSAFLSLLLFAQADIVERFEDEPECLKYFYSNKVPLWGASTPDVVRLCQRFVNTFHFATLYDTYNHIAVYSAYIFEPSNGGGRESRWFVEPQLVNGNWQAEMKDGYWLGRDYPGVYQGERQALNEDYTHSGFDRGHLNPNGHHAVPSRNATFTLTNVVPQNPKMNQNAWANYESSLTTLFKSECSQAFVLVGAIPSADNWIIKNNVKRVNIPDYLWNAYCCVDNNGTPILSGGATARNTEENIVNKISLDELRGFLQQFSDQSVVNQSWMDDKEMMEESDVKRRHHNVDLGINQALDGDYRDTVYDRGHLNPDSHNMGDSKEATYTLTNIVPQTRSLNQHTWKDYENKLTTRFRQCAQAFVLVGAIPSENNWIVKNNVNRVNIPRLVWNAYCCVHNNGSRLVNGNWQAEMKDGYWLGRDYPGVYQGERQALNEDYTHSGFDRGHLNPNGHHAVPSRNATFTLTNVVPQNPKMNQNAWANYESSLTTLFKSECSQAFVLVGAIPSADNWIIKNNVKRVNIPDPTSYCCVDNNGTPILSGGATARNTEENMVKKISLDELGGFLQQFSDQSLCKSVLYKKKMPDLKAFQGNAVHICQRLNNRYHFATLYDKTHRIAVYSAYIFMNPGKKGKGNERTSRWCIEPQLVNQYWTDDKEMMEESDVKRRHPDVDLGINQALDGDYRDTVYDRGHLNPNSHNMGDSKEATYTLTNIVPQTKSLNQHTWKDYENKLTTRFRQCAKAFVLVGAIPSKNNWIVKNNVNRVNIPRIVWNAYCCVHNNGSRLVNQSWKDDKEMMDESDVKRRHPDVDLGINQALDGDYRDTVYDRGHLNPNSHNMDNSKEATRTLTNIVPQNRTLNQNAWANYESSLTTLFKSECSQAFVLVGAIPSADNWIIRNNVKRVNIPDYLWNAYCCVDNNGTPILSGGATANNNEGNIVNKISLDELRGFLQQFSDQSLVQKSWEKDMMDEETLKFNHPGVDLGANQALDGDYKDSGYDRGHLNPNLHNKDLSRQATYTLTNVVPQTEKLNQRVWEPYENELITLFRDTRCTQAFVLVGAIPSENKWIVKNNVNRVNIPKSVWNAYCCVDNNGNPTQSGGAIARYDSEKLEEYGDLKRMKRDLKLDPALVLFHNDCQN